MVSAQALKAYNVFLDHFSSMSHPTPQDPEGGNDPTVNRDHSQSAPNQPSQLESNIGDSSEPLFSMYTKAAEEEDNKMVDSWQKDAKGIIIFTGLFSATVAALLTVTIPDLKPNSQDTSAFYLGNIYQVLADPNVTRASVPSSDAKPPPFSVPRHAVWVNSLWFLSLVMSVSCALWATSLNQWARRYIHLTQPARCRPEKRARMRAFFADGVDKMHTPWAVEGLPMLLHLSLFLFFGGLAVYLFNLNQEVFICVVSWIGLFLAIYGLISLLPIIRHDSPYNTPLSTPLWLLFTHISSAAIIVFYFTFFLSFNIFFACFFRFQVFFNVEGASDSLHEAWDIITREFFRWRRTNSLLKNILMLLRVKTTAEETVEEQSSEIDGRILGWTISTLGDDESLEKFFEAMPGFFDSEKVEYPRRHLPCELLRDALAGFLGRTLSSKSVVDSVKLRRLDTFIKTIGLVGEYTIRVSSILEAFLSKRWVLVPQTIEVAQTLARWCTSNDPRTALYARCTLTRVLATVPERDDRWVELAVQISGQPKHVLQDLAQTDLVYIENNLILVALIGLCRQAIHSHEWKLVSAFSRFDIRHTLPRLQHDFCTLWNEFVDEGRTSGDSNSPFFRVVCLIGHLYNALHWHQAVSAPTASSSSIDTLQFIIDRPDSYNSYPKCDIPDHLYHPDSIDHACDVTSLAFPLLNQPGDSPHSLVRRSTSDGITISRQVKQEGITKRSRSLSQPTPKDIAEAPTATSPSLLPVHIGPYPINSSLSGAVAAPQYIPPTATLLHPLEGTSQQEAVPPCGKPDIGEIQSIASTPAPAPTPVPVPTSTPVLKESLGSIVGFASVSDPLPPQLASSVVGVFTPTRSRDPFSPNPESLALLSNTTPSHPTGNATLPHLRTLGLLNTGNMSSANAVLQLLVHSPPLWDLLRELGDLKGRHRAGDPETVGGATPLVDATVRFFEEFISKEEPLQQAARGEPSEDEEVKMAYNAADSFEPIYMYDAMKEKKRLKDLLDGQQQDAEAFFRLYLDALDEELLALLPSITHDKSAGVEEREASQPGPTEVREGGSTAKSVQSPLMRIFGGKFRSTVHAPNQPDTVTIEEWRSPHLDIDSVIEHDSVYTIEEALARISHLQPVQLGPSGFGGASRKVLIEELPPVLVLHLKRFLYDAAADVMIKINRPVQFAPELDIPLEIMAPISGKSAEPATYKLYGVLYHQGESAGRWHYTVDVLHPNGDPSSGDTWMRIDDDVVSAVRHDDVFGVHDNERAEERCAYMLFYRRTAHTQA